MLLAMSSSLISVMTAIANQYFSEFLTEHISLNKMTAIFVTLSFILFLMALRSSRHYLTMASILWVLFKRRIADGQTYRLLLIEDFKSLTKGLELDRDTYDEEHTWTIERWRNFFHKNPNIAYGLVHSDDNEYNNILGGISVFPLKEQTYAGLMRGEIDEMDLTGESILSPSEESICRYWIIPGMVLFNRGKSLMPAGVMIYSFVRQMSERVRYPATILAYAYSELGERLLKRFKFNPVPGNPHKLHKRTFASIHELNDVFPFSSNQRQRV